MKRAEGFYLWDFADLHMATYPRVELSKLLSEITLLGLTKILFTLGGSDFNENAIKLAKALTRRHKIIVLECSYHEATYGAVALTGNLW